METEPPPPCEESPWKGAGFVLLLVLFLLMPAADFAAIHGDQAAHLQIWGAAVVRVSPLLMLASAVFTPLIFAGTRLARWRHGITELVIILCVFSAPLLLLVRSSSIPLSRGMTIKESEDLRKDHPIPSVRYSASGEGYRLRVRREDDTAELRSYLRRMGVLRAGG